MNTSLPQATPEQHTAASAPAGVIRIMAGPGSGKTFVMAERIAHLIQHQSIPPAAILVLSFTRKATQELQERLTKLLPEQAEIIQIKTLHSLCLSICLEGSNSYFQLTESEPIIRRALNFAIRRCESDPSFPVELLEPDTALRLLTRMKHCEPDAFIDEATHHDIQLCKAFDEFMHQHGVRTFMDLAPLALQLLTKKPDILSLFQQRYEAFLVDEAQDLNPVQFAIIRKLGGRNPHLTMAGDDDQAVYSWRGADPDVLLSLQHEFPQALTYELNQNFRCPPSVVRCSSNFIRQNNHRYEKSLVSMQSTGAPVRICHFVDEKQEVQALVNEVKKLISASVPAHEIAILARSNLICNRIVSTFCLHQIPVFTENQLHSQQGQLLVSLLHVLLSGKDSPHFAKVLNLGQKRINKAVLREVVKRPLRPNEVGPFLYAYTKQNPKQPLSLLLSPLLLAVDLARQRIAHKEPLVSILHQVFEAFGIPSVVTAQGPLKKLTLSRQQILFFANKVQHSLIPLASLIAHIELLHMRAPTGQSAVQVLTLHRSKGLQFDYVFIPSVVAGIFPPKSALYDTLRLEEERRLLYVGMTRAKKQLMVSHYKSSQVPEWHGFVDELDVHPTDQGVFYG